MLSSESSLPLRNHVTRDPCLYSVFHLFFSELYLESGKVLSVGWLVETYLHCHLHHQPTQHEGRIFRGTADRYGPGA